MNKKVLKLFKNGNCCVFGLRGTGKDLLFGNVISRINKPYVSNLDYTNNSLFHYLKLSKINVKNTYLNFLNNDVNFYEYPYPYSSDIYISDAGVYFPSQYNSELNKKYPYFPVYMALSRQISKNNFHFNTQSLNRVWDKIREQSDTYILCLKCFYLFGLVIQKIRIYDRYDTAVSKIAPCRVHSFPFSDKYAREQRLLYLDNFYNTHGLIKDKWLIYFNKSKHDTFYFGNLLKNGCKNPLPF